MKHFSSLFLALTLALSIQASEHHAPLAGLRQSRAAHLFAVPQQANLQNLSLQAPARAALATNTDLSTQITMVDCQYYSNAAYSQTGHYDYYWTLAAGVDADGYLEYPTIIYDLYLPTNQGLVDGTYTMAAGQL